MITPASAGPTARLILTPTLLAATAAERSSLGTSCGTIDCQAGASRAESVLLTNMNSSNVHAVTRLVETRTANTTETRVTRTSRARMKRRLSMMSASAPAGSANRNIGKLAAACTRDTIKGSESRLVINQPAAALYIQPPMLATTVAAQSSLKMRPRNGLQNDAGVTFCGGASFFFPDFTALSHTDTRLDHSNSEMTICYRLPQIDWDGGRGVLEMIPDHTATAQSMPAC
jgi:hypothetical protein